MKRFVTILTVIIATAAIVLTVIPATFAADSGEKFLVDNNYDIFVNNQRCDVDIAYENGTIVVTITNPTYDYKVECRMWVGRNQDEPAAVGTPVKFILPDGTILNSVVNLDGEYRFEYNPEYRNRIEYGYDELGYCTNMSALAGDAVINALYGGATYTEPVTDNGSIFTWDVFDHLMKLCIENWHYSLEKKNTFYEGPKDLDKVLNAAKGTHYEDLIVEWVNKVRTEREDYAYYQEMQNGNAEIPTVETPVVKANKFTDVTTAHWANANIEKIANLGYFSGYEDGTFRPDNQITHEEFIKVIVDFGLDGTENAPANSASANWAEWAQPYLNAALNAGIVTADDTDLLAVNTPITRGEMAKVIGRLKTYLTGTNNTTADVSDKIADWNNIPDAYKNYVAEAYNEGILSGYEDGTFKSNKSLTRAEASSVIVKLIDDDEPAVTTPTENVNTIVEPANNIHVIYHLFNQDKELTSKSQFVILNGEVMLPIDSIGGFMYKKSTNTIRSDYTELPISTDGAPADYIVGKDKTEIHSETPVQIINGTIMIPLTVMREVMKPETFTWYID